MTSFDIMVDHLSAQRQERLNREMNAEIARRLLERSDEEFWASFFSPSDGVKVGVQTVYNEISVCQA